MTGAATIVFGSDDELLPALLSPAVATVAVFVGDVPAPPVTLPVNVFVVPAFGAMAFEFVHATATATAQLQPVPVPDTNVITAGNVSLTVIGPVVAVLP